MLNANHRSWLVTVFWEALETRCGAYWRNYILRECAFEGYARSLAPSLCLLPVLCEVSSQPLPPHTPTTKMFHSNARGMGGDLCRVLPGKLSSLKLFMSDVLS